MYDQHLKPAGILSTQFGMLSRIASMDEPVITDLGHALCLDQTTTTRNIELLERHGFVTCMPHPGDARKKKVALSARGKAKLDQATPLWEQAQETIRERLGADGLDSLSHALEAIRDLAGVP